jgi:hypothetical protein
MTEHRATWIAALAKLTTPHDAERAAQAMSAYMPFLCELPEAAFTLASMRHVAMAQRRMMIPDLREVLDPLEAWWRENRPARTALPAPSVKPADPDVPVSEDERQAVRRQLAALADSLAPPKPERPAPRAHVFQPEVLERLREEARAKLRGVG